MAVVIRPAQRDLPLQLPPIPHAFAIGPAGPLDPFGHGGQRYTCIRCKASFVVKGRKIVVLDEAGTPMKGEDATARLTTFAAGPCAPLPSASNRNKLGLVGNGRAHHE
jgi:hypothetical protein